MWLELDRTCEEIARFSRADAQAYRRLLAEYDAVKDVFAPSASARSGCGPSFEEWLAGRPGAERWRRRAAMSAWDVVSHEFQSRHVRAFMLWMAFQTGQPVGSAGLGAARLLDRLRASAPQLDDPTRRLGRAGPSARRGHRGGWGRGPV